MFLSASAFAPKKSFHDSAKIIMSFHEILSTENCFLHRTSGYWFSLERQYRDCMRGCSLSHAFTVTPSARIFLHANASETPSCYHFFFYCLVSISFFMRNRFQSRPQMLKVLKMQHSNCRCIFNRLIKIKEWVDKNDPGAILIPFSGAFENKVIDMDEAERAKYFEESKVTR